LFRNWQLQVSTTKTTALSGIIKPSEALPADAGLHTYGCYPNTETALHSLQTSSVTTASYEMNFSKLKIIKHYSYYWLSNLSILSMRYDTANCINFNVVIDEFASIKARGVIL